MVCGKHRESLSGRSAPPQRGVRTGNHDRSSEAKRCSGRTESDLRGLKASRLNSVTIVKVKAVLEMVGMGGKEANQKNRPQQRDPARRDSRGCRVP